MAKLVLGADGGKPLAVRLLARERIERDLQRHVGADRGEELRHLRVLRAGGHLLGHLALEVSSVGDQVLNGAELREERGGSLLANALDAGDVVGRVAREREPVDHLRRGDEAPVLLHARLVVDLRAVARASGTEQADVRRDELGGVLVGRREVHVEAFGGGAHGEGAHHVVRLEALLANERQAQGLRQLERVGDVGGEILGHLLALRLVWRIRLVPERGAARVHRQHRVRGLPVLEDGDDPVREPDESGGGDAGGRHARVAQEHEMPAVEERHHVDDEERLLLWLVLFFGHVRLRLCCYAAHYTKKQQLQKRGENEIMPP